jgi:hypothetical protein
MKSKYIFLIVLSVISLASLISYQIIKSNIHLPPLQPTPIGGTQCDNPTLSDGSTTGQMAISGGATCTVADAVVMAANNKNGANYSSNGYTCTGTKQGSNTQWSSYWNNAFYTYTCSNGSSQVAFNLQTTAQSTASSTTPITN